MFCPFCHAQDTRVLDSRLNPEENTIRRRRRCDQCEKRFTTYETIEFSMPMVVKNDGRRENYQKEKIAEGIKKACQKRPVSTGQIEKIMENIEKNLLDLNEKEVTTKLIGSLVMSHLRFLDPVAYVRFASVYRTFKDIDEFVHDLKQNEINRKDKVIGSSGTENFLE